MPGKGTDSVVLSCRFRQCFARSPASAYVALLLLLPACGRLGVEILPSPLNEQETDATEHDAAMDAGTLAMDATTEDADLGAQADGANAPRDAASAMSDATNSMVDSANTASTEAGAVSDAGARDAGSMSGAGDAGPGDAGPPPVPPGLRIVVDNPGGATLRDFPVRVLLDTQTLIKQGQLATDCSNLRVFGSDRCGEARFFFLPEHSCNTSMTEVWVRVPELLPGAREVFSATFDSATGAASNGAQVFPFFDGFDGSALDRTRWIAHGQGTVSVAAGVLQSQSIMLLESVSAAVTAGNSIVGARLAATGQLDTDVELGAGTVSSDAIIWAYGRSWDGVTFVSYDITSYAFDGPSGSACDDMANSQLAPQLGQPWVDHPPTTASFLTAEFGYANQGGRTQAWLRSSRGASFNYTSPAGCTLPTALPVLVSLDHNAEASSPIQRVDYVYVRPTTASEPTASVLTASSYACGTEP